jgi:Spy/CpxP family protein refolding chaperone
MTSLLIAPPGRWWDDPPLARKVGLTADQQEKMDDIFNANRLKLIDLFAGVQKEDAILDPLVNADSPDETKVLAQVDRLAQAKADLERTIARMLLDLRLQLTHDQWVKLKAQRASSSEMGNGFHGRPYPGMSGGPAGGPHP